MVNQRDINDLEGILSLTSIQLQAGELDRLIWNQDFFDLTEAIMLDLVSGRQLSIQMDEIYRARSSVIRAIQDFYFYCVNKIS